MWMSDVHSIGGYMFAAGLFFLGLTGWQVLVAMLVGIVFVYGFMLMSAAPASAPACPFRCSRGSRSASSAPTSRR